MRTFPILFNAAEILVPSQSISQVRADLFRYGTHYGISGLESRLVTGLDPIGVLAVHETRERLSRIASPMGASMRDVSSLTHGLFQNQHRSGISSAGDGPREDRRSTISLENPPNAGP